MGASIVRGIDLRKEHHADDDGGHWCEIVPVDGGHEGFSYSTVESLVRFGETMDVLRELWPIYYDVERSDILIDTVREQCSALRAGFPKPLRWYDKQLRRQGPNLEKVARWFPRIYAWLARGDIRDSRVIVPVRWTVASRAARAIS